MAGESRGWWRLRMIMCVPSSDPGAGMARRCDTSTDPPVPARLPNPNPPAGRAGHPRHAPSVHRHDRARTGSSTPSRTWPRTARHERQVQAVVWLMLTSIPDAR